MSVIKWLGNVSGIKKTNNIQQNAQTPYAGDFSNAQYPQPQLQQQQPTNQQYQQQLMAQNNQYQQPTYQQPANYQLPLQQPQLQPQPQYQQPQPNAPILSTYEYQQQMMNNSKNVYKPLATQPVQQELIMPRSRNVQQSHRRKQIPLEYENGAYQQNFLDFNAPNPVEYGNFQEQSELEKYNSNFNYYEQSRNQTSAPIQPYGPRYEEPINYNSYYQQSVPAPSRQQQDAYYQPNVNQGYYLPKEKRSSEKRANILPPQIAKEVRSEKLRVAILMIIGTVGIVITSILIAGYFKLKGEVTAYRVAHPDEQKYDPIFAGFRFSRIPYPFVSISFLIIATLLFFLGATDYTLLYSNIKKYERDLISGNESVPYFITRNYKNIVSRGVYVTWICFATYIGGSISLGILYGLQGAYVKNLGGNHGIYFLFWKMGTLKSFKSDITTNIIVLVGTLIIHISNIVWSRARKNNVIGYYGQPIISSDEERIIKKRANKICIIIMCVLLAIILFAIIIPWLIVRRKQGKRIRPWGTNY